METTRTVITRKPARKVVIPAAPEAALANLGPWQFPKRADFVCDWAPAKGGNSRGVAASWSNDTVRAARTARHGVRVTCNGSTSEYRSVKEAFRALRLPLTKHIKFRGALKASGKEAFTDAEGRVVMFALIEE